MNSKLSRKARIRLTRFEEAVEILAFRGASDPDLWEEIDALYERAKQRLEEYILELENSK